MRLLKTIRCRDIPRTEEHYAQDTEDTDVGDGRAGDDQ